MTDRDRVVAELVPPAAGRSAIPGDAMFEEMVRRGRISLPILPPEGVPLRCSIASFEDRMGDLCRDRDGR